MRTTACNGRMRAVSGDEVAREAELAEARK